MKISKKFLILILISFVVLCSCNETSNDDSKEHIFQETSSISLNSETYDSELTEFSVDVSDIIETSAILISEETVVTSDITKEKLIDGVYYLDEIGILGRKTDEDIIKDFLKNYDINIDTQYGKSDEEILKNLLDKNVINFYTYIEQTCAISLLYIVDDLVDNENNKYYKIEHQKFGKDFEILKKFTLSTYTEQYYYNLVNNDISTDYNIIMWSKNGEIYSNRFVLGIFNKFPFYLGYDFEIINISDTEIKFNIYYYEQFEIDRVRLISRESKAIKENGEWRLTEMIY
jgi:hypothetical protein